MRLHIWRKNVAGQREMLTKCKLFATLSMHAPFMTLGLVARASLGAMEGLVTRELWFG